MKVTTKRAAARLFFNKLRSLGLPSDHAAMCARESAALANVAASPDLALKMFRLRRAEYCLRRYHARWGYGVGRRATRIPAAA